MTGYYFEDISTVTQRQYRHWLSLLPEFRRNKALGYRRYEDSLRCVIAYLLLWRALEEETDSTLPPPEFRYNENGKPYLKYATKTLTKPFFNLSHTDDFVACALSEQEIGVDVQRKIDWSPELAHHICTAFELRLFEKSSWSDEDKSLQLTQLWTLKESYLKAIGTGLAEEPGKLDFSAFLSKDMSCDRIEMREHIFQIQRKARFPGTVLTACRRPETAAFSWRRLSPGEWGRCNDAMPQ